MPPELTPAVAAAIRATWPKHMRQTYAQVPGFFTHCACQHGITPLCREGRHKLCGRATSLRRTEGSICDTRGNVTTFPEPYQHVTDINTTGPRRTSVAQVWLADRVCRWQCPCDCHAEARALPARRTAAADQLSLLDLIDN